MEGHDERLQRRKGKRKCIERRGDPRKLLLTTVFFIIMDNKGSITDPTVLCRLHVARPCRPVPWGGSEEPPRSEEVRFLSSVYFKERNRMERNGTQGYFTEQTSVITERLI